LQILKIVAFVVSKSYSVLASTIDSLVDILSQALVALANQ
jgi:divalent metal cation (Fe/Co/Zn/Cd) transporter